ncbi:glycosyltransferase family 4 protein [Methanocella sp. MCL-LM]|uniref:glycosyltransferase family 4 protein n=1 Tax=Methanocella sp. MCL-LM TaxID=3412035 RepID=UPI003C73DFF7
METLNICVATYKLFEGNGIDVSVIQFAEELARKHNVKVLAVDASDSIKSLDVQRVPANNPLKMRQIAADIDRQKFDVISTHYTPFDLVASLCRTPHFLHDPGVPPAITMRKPADAYLWSLVNTARLVSARKARVVLPISGYLANEFRKKYLYFGKTEILPYCIDFPDSMPEPARLPFEKYVLYVGRHTRYKGVHDLIDIFDDARKEIGDDVHLVTIGLGEPRYVEILKQKAASVGNVHILGFVQDIWPYYTGASVYATCSQWEGQDRPVIEAQYAGKPVVSYNNCSHPEVIVNGTLAKSRSEFKDALVRYLMTKPAGSGGSTEMVKRYAPEKMADSFTEIVKRAVDGNGA